MTTCGSEAKIPGGGGGPPNRTSDPAQPIPASPDDWHKPCPGQTQLLCDFYITILRSIIMAQSYHIADLERRVNGKPLTWTWLDGVYTEHRDDAVAEEMP